MQGVSQRKDFTSFDVFPGIHKSLVMCYSPYFGSLSWSGCNCTIPCPMAAYFPGAPFNEPSFATVPIHCFVYLPPYPFLFLMLCVFPFITCSSLTRFLCEPHFPYYSFFTVTRLHLMTVDVSWYLKLCSLACQRLTQLHSLPHCKHQSFTQSHSPHNEGYVTVLLRAFNLHLSRFFR